MDTSMCFPSPSNSCHARRTEGERPRGHSPVGFAAACAVVLGACSRDLTPRVDTAAAAFLADSATDAATPTYIGPSPDGRYVLGVDSVDYGTARWVVTDVTTGEVTRVVTIREVDPDSGRSDQLRWTRDSRALVITGTGSLHGDQPQPLCLVYRVKERDLIMPERCQADGTAAGGR